MLRPRDGLLDDPRQIPVPGRKFLTEDDGKLFVFPEDNGIGRFGVEAAHPRRFPGFSFARPVCFAQCMWIMERDSHLFKNVLWLAAGSPRECRGIASQSAAAVWDGKT